MLVYIRFIAGSGLFGLIEPMIDVFKTSPRNTTLVSSQRHRDDEGNLKLEYEDKSYRDFLHQ